MKKLIIGGAIIAGALSLLVFGADKIAEFTWFTIKVGLLGPLVLIGA